MWMVLFCILCGRIVNTCLILNALCLLLVAGDVNVSVAGVVSSPARTPSYNFQSLIQPPVVSSVAPITGVVAGGTVVTIVGSGFNFDAVVMLVERNATFGLTGSESECDWKSGQGLLCNDTTVM